MKATKPVAALVAVLLSGAGLFGFVSAAHAEDIVPPADPVVVEVAPEEAPETISEAPQVETKSARVVESVSVKLPICHSGSGAHWSYIAPDASGYNGHQNHSLDIYGLTEAECLAKNPVDDPEDTSKYAVLIWAMEPSGETPDFDPDQTLVDSVTGLGEPDLGYFDDLLVGKCTAFQIDVYHYDEADGSKAKVDFLILTGVLQSPNNPAEPLIAGALGTAWKFYVNTDCSIDIQECETVDTVATSTNVNPHGWTLENGEWVDGGVEFTASNWSDAYAVKDVNFPLSEANNLTLNFTGGIVWAIILETTAGNVHYEPEPYTDDLWTNSAGILPANAGGQGGPYSGNLEDILSDPTVTKVYLYFTSGSSEPESGTLHSGGYNCLNQPFDHENIELPVPALFAADPTPPDCGVAGSFSFSDEFPNVDVTITPAYSGPGEYLIEATTADGYEFPDGTTYKSKSIEVLGALLYQNANSEVDCYVEPKATEAVQSESECGDTSIEETRTVFTLDPATGLYDEGVTSVVTVAIDPEECPSDDGELAFTGTQNVGVLGLAGLSLLLIGALFAAVHFARRKLALKGADSEDVE